MPERAYRQLLRDAPVERSPTATGDSVLRLAMGMLCADPRAPLSPDERQKMLDRLQATTQSFSTEEKGKLRDPLLAYLTQHYPRIVGIVEAQFAKEPA